MNITIHSKIKDENLPMGFLSPNCKFYNVPYGKHEKFAGEYCIEHDLIDEENQWENDGYGHVLYRDFLIEEKGFILLDCPMDNNESFATFNINKINVKQAMWLIDYYVRINDSISLSKLKRHLNL